MRIQARWLASLVALVSFTCATPEPDGLFLLDLDLVDQDGGRSVAGLVRVRTPDGKAVAIPSLLPRGMGLPSNHPANEWHVLPGRSTLRLPREKLTLEAFRGLETELARIEV